MNRVLLNNVDHSDLKVAILHGAAFGDEANRVPLFPSEFAEAQRDFPIVFRRAEDGIDAFALLGFERGENLSFDNGAWTSRYVPAIQRRGPFSIALARADPDARPEEETGGELMIHVDLDDPRVGADGGVPMFLDHGGNAAYLDHIGDVLRIIFDGVQNARAINAALDAAGLLHDVAISIDAGDAGTFELTDLLTIDQAALAALTGGALDRLHRAGLLQAAVMAAASLGNLPALIERKSRRAASR